MRNIITTSSTTAPNVSASALARFFTKLFGSVWSRATLTPVTRAAIAPEALHSATATAITSVIDTPAPLALPIDVICCWMNRCTSSGSAPAKSRT